jgi:hypothetical protein
MNRLRCFAAMRAAAVGWLGFRLRIRGPGWRSSTPTSILRDRQCVLSGQLDLAVGLRD